MSDSEAVGTKLANMQTRYRKALREVQEDADLRVDSANKTNEIQLKNAKDSYSADKQRISEANAKTMSEQSRSVNQLLDDQTNRFQNQVSDMRSKFDRESFVNQKELQEKLDKISGEYRTKEELRDVRNDNLLDEAKKTADMRMRRDAQNSARDREEFTEATKLSMRELLDDNADTIKDVSERHQKDMLQNNEYNLREKSRIRSSLGEYIEDLKNTGNTDKEALLKEKHVAIKNLENNKKLERLRLESEFAGTIDNFSAKAEEQRLRTERDLSGQLNYERKSAQDNTRKNNNILNDMIATAQTNQKVHANQLGNSVEKMNMIKQNAVNNELESERNFAQKHNELDRKHMNARTQEKTELLTASRNNYNDLLNDKISSVNDEKRDSRLMLNRYQQQIRQVNKANDLKVFENNQQTKKILNENNDRHNNRLIEMSNRNRHVLEEYKGQSREEKAQIIEDTRDRVAQTGLNLRKSFGDKIANLEEVHSKKVEQLQETIDKKIKNYENLLASSEKRSVKMFEEFQKMSATEQKLQKNEFLQQIKDNEAKKVQQLKKNQDIFERKLGQAKDHAELRMMEVVNRYETEISTERKNFYRVLKQKMTQSQRALKSLTQRLDGEKVALRDQMESRIADLQNENRRIRQLNKQRAEYLEPIKPEEIG